MLDLNGQLRSYMIDTTEAVDVDELITRHESDHASRSPRANRRMPRWAFAVTAAVGLLLVIGGASFLLGGSEGSAPPAQSTTPSTAPTTPTTVPAPTTLAPGTAVTPDAWTPILASTDAREIAGIDTCPDGSTPDAVGDASQLRPAAGAVSILGAAFDQARGVIVTIDLNGDTWTFDVCTNTWHNTGANAEEVGSREQGFVNGAPGTNFFVPPLAYDADSDVTVALGFEDVWVYDAGVNSWTEQPNRRPDDLLITFGAVYHEPSGLIVTTSYRSRDSSAFGSLDAWAYDVDANTWTRIGTISDQAEQLDLYGYSASLDRFILTGWFNDDYESAGARTLLMDPATGAQTILDIESPHVDLLWPGGRHGVGNDTVYIQQRGGTQGLCGFDTATLAWTDCHDAPTTGTRTADAIVGDPINNRLVILPGPLPAGSRDLWSIDPNTGQWTALVSMGEING